MYHIYDNLGIQSIDTETIAHGTDSKELIYRASKLFCSWFRTHISKEQHVLILCGYGNNGADGYVIGEQLAARGYTVTIGSLNQSKKRSAENLHFLHKILDNCSIEHLYVEDINQLVSLEEYVSVIIDALVGNGTNRPLDGFLCKLVTYVNGKYENIYAVDSPTGLLSSSEETQLAMTCKGTYSFQFPKKTFFAAEHEQYVGEWKFGDIGLNQNVIEKTPTDTYLFDKTDIAKMIYARASFAHKGLMGRALQIIGESHMKGAGVMAAMACSKMGAGHTFVFDASQNNHSVADNHPHLIHAKSLDSIFLSTIKALAIGPGLGQSNEAAALLRKILDEYDQAMVLDADALNIMAKEDWIYDIQKGCIITPHIKEFSRLFGASKGHLSRIELQRAKAQEHSIYIILKGHYTSIATPDGDIYYNRSGNPAMAKGGSGDVLTGMLLGLLAQGYNTLSACLIATFIHGHSADLWLQNHHEMTLEPLDLITYIDLALKDTTR